MTNIEEENHKKNERNKFLRFLEILLEQWRKDLERYEEETET